MGKGRFLMQHWIFGSGIRFGIIDYIRPSAAGGEEKRCVRVQASRFERGSPPEEPLSLELAPSTAAALLAVLSGDRDQCGQRLVRPGLAKLFGCMAKTHAGTRGVLPYSVRLSAADCDYTCSLTEDDALHGAAVILHHFAATAPVDVAVWVDHVRRHGRSVADRFQRASRGMGVQT